MTIPLEVPSSTVDALARGRQAMLMRASAIMSDSDASMIIDRETTVPALAGMLMSSLEELKVAEEEMREQNVSLISRREADDRRIRHYQQLFAHLPVPAIVTDLNASIIEANLAALTLFRREGRHLERKPLSALVETQSRDEFRNQLGHAKAIGETRRFRLTLHRVGDIPLEMHATVALVPELGPTSSGVLFWMFDAIVEGDLLHSPFAATGVDSRGAIASENEDAHAPPGGAAAVRVHVASPSGGAGARARSRPG